MSNLAANEVKQAIEKNGLQIHIGVNNMVTPYKSEEIHPATYYHVGGHMIATAPNELVMNQQVGAIKFDIVDTSIYPDIDAISEAVANDMASSDCDHLAIWSMLGTLYEENEDDVNMCNAILGGKIAIIHMFEVHEDYQHIGIGKNMLSALKEYLDFFEVNSIVLIPAPIGSEKGKEIKLSVDKKRDHLNRFYQSNEFKVVAFEDNYLAIYTF